MTIRFETSRAVRVAASSFLDGLASGVRMRDGREVELHVHLELRRADEGRT